MYLALLGNQCHSGPIFAPDDRYPLRSDREPSKVVQKCSLFTTEDGSKGRPLKTSAQVAFTRCARFVVLWEAFTILDRRGSVYSKGFSVWPAGFDVAGSPAVGAKAD